MTVGSGSDDAPRVSVILPTYNRRDLLHRSVASIQAQTYSSWELIVVDDGSTDDSLATLPQDARIRVIRLPHTGNLAAVRNAGLFAARGVFIGFNDSDDRWRPDKLARQIEALDAAPGAQWCFSGYELMDAQEHTIPLRAGAPTTTTTENLFASLIDGSAGIALQTVLVREAIARRVAFDNRVAFGEDLDFLVRLSHAGAAHAMTSVLADVRQHAGRSTRTRYDQGLYLAAAFRRYRRLAPDRAVRKACARRARQLTREYCARARGAGHLWTAVARSMQLWLSRPD